MSSFNARTAERLLKRLEDALHESSKSIERSGLSASALRFLRSRPESRTALDVAAVTEELARQAWLAKLPPIVLKNDQAFRDLLTIISTAKLDTPEVSIHDHGEPVQIFYVVLSGSLELRSADGKDPIVLTSGDVTGENFVHEDAVWERDLYVQQVSAECTEVIMIHQHDFDRVIEQYIEGPWPCLRVLSAHAHKAMLTR